MAARVAALLTAGAAHALPDIAVSLMDRTKGDTNQLYTVNQDGSSAKQITQCPKGCVQPNWSPDGRLIAFVEQTATGLQLRVAAPDGSGMRAVDTDRPAGKVVHDRLPNWMNDSRRIVFERKTGPETQPTYPECGPSPGDEVHSSELWVVDTQTGDARPLFDATVEQSKFSNLMPTLPPDNRRIAFTSDRNGTVPGDAVRLWIANLDGTDARLAAPNEDLGANWEVDLQSNGCITPVEQKAPAFAWDNKHIAFLEGVEEVYLSSFTKINNPQRDQIIQSTWQIYVVDVDSGVRKHMRRGDDPAWSPDNRVSSASPNSTVQGPQVTIETAPWPSLDWAELPILPHPQTRSWGRMAWAPKTA